MEPPSAKHTPSSPDSSNQVAPASQLGLEEIFAGVAKQIDQADRSPAWKVRMQPTILRRCVALFCVLTLLVIAGAVMSARSLSDLGDPFNLIGLGGLGLLLLISVWNATRPMHLPALSRPASVALGAACVLGAFAFAAFSVPGIELGLEGHAAEGKPMACLSMGLLFGIPVYGLLRLLDRGSRISALIASLAAGLTGNMAIHLHCALNSREHEMRGHFPVLLAFIAAIGLWEGISALRRRKRRSKP